MENIINFLLSIGFEKYTEDNTIILDSYEFKGLHRYHIYVYETYINVYKDKESFSTKYFFKEFKNFINNEKDFLYIIRQNKIKKLLDEK